MYSYFDNTNILIKRIITYMYEENNNIFHNKFLLYCNKFWEDRPSLYNKY